ncbi:MAG: GTPase HflX [Myxococcota bacterium]|nr:GTPase HflX [Myxococcota bacterium]
MNRRGHVEHVVVGDAHKIVLPDLGRHRAGRGRLRGIRLLHTHLQQEPLTRDDLTDLALLRLDYVAALEVLDTGRPGLWHGAHILPKNLDGRLWEVEPPRNSHDVISDLDFESFIRELEATLSRQSDVQDVDTGFRAVLVQVALPDGPDPEVTRYELRELCATAGVSIVDEVIQKRTRVDHRTCIGRGKLEELALRAMQIEADLAVFDRDLTPTQVRMIADVVEMKVIDRTQLILDIFAQRAQTREGKLQVELAQLKYRLPRLSRSNAAFSRLGGGVGGRGPGEQKLEIDRRRVKERITLLQRDLKRISKSRTLRRQKRQRGRVPVVSIVGYTNAGKSTLLNTLTQAKVLSEDKLFATLDPTSRRLRLPREREIVITDTVGFIRDLPADLIRAFEATLEELQDADLLLHVVDATNNGAEEHVETVNAVIDELKLGRRPSLLVLNKTDRLSAEEVKNLEQLHDGIGVSALSPKSLMPLLERIEQELWQTGKDVESLTPNRGYAADAVSEQTDKLSDAMTSWNPLDH